MSEGLDDPQVWPACSQCQMAYVLRRCMRFTDSTLVAEWLWQRDCNHKNAEPVLVGPATVAEEKS